MLASKKMSSLLPAVVRLKLKGLIAKRSMIILDVACGEHKHQSPGTIGMDRRNVKGVDIVHDIEELPWPLPGETFDGVICSHIVEHIKPWLIFDVIDEIWRVCKPSGKLLIVTPYATSAGFYQDPSHCHGWVEATPAYFDPNHPGGLYDVYKVKPWHIVRSAWRADMNLEIALEKMPLDWKEKGWEPSDQKSHKR